VRSSVESRLLNVGDAIDGPRSSVASGGREVIDARPP
jgi:hypothetical protein